MDDSGNFGAPPPPPPPSAGGGGQIPQRGLGDILSNAFELYKANAVKLIQIVAIVVIPLTFILALLTQVALKQNCDNPSIVLQNGKAPSSDAKWTSAPATGTRSHVSAA